CLGGHFGAFLARFREADGDGLLAALHGLAAFTALQLAAFELVHGSLDGLLRLFAVFPGHDPLPGVELAQSHAPCAAARVEKVQIACRTTANRASLKVERKWSHSSMQSEPLAIGDAHPAKTPLLAASGRCIGRAARLQIFWVNLCPT